MVKFVITHLISLFLITVTKGELQNDTIWLDKACSSSGPSLNNPRPKLQLKVNVDDDTRKLNEQLSDEVAFPVADAHLEDDKRMEKACNWIQRTSGILSELKSYADTLSSNETEIYAESLDQLGIEQMNDLKNDLKNEFHRVINYTKEGEIKDAGSCNKSVADVYSLIQYISDRSFLIDVPSELTSVHASIKLLEAAVFNTTIKMQTCLLTSNSDCLENTILNGEDDLNAAQITLTKNTDEINDNILRLEEHVIPAAKYCMESLVMQHHSALRQFERLRDILQMRRSDVLRISNFEIAIIQKITREETEKKMKDQFHQEMGFSEEQMDYVDMDFCKEEVRNVYSVLQQTNRTVEGPCVKVVKNMSNAIFATLQSAEKAINGIENELKECLRSFNPNCVTKITSEAYHNYRAVEVRVIEDAAKLDEYRISCQSTNRDSCVDFGDNENYYNELMKKASNCMLADDYV